MKINEKQLKELRNCELYQKILPKYQKTVEWIIKEYIELTERENIPIKCYFVTEQDNGSIKIHSSLETEINQRHLLNLNDLNFDFGLKFLTDGFMPFFAEKDVALFNTLYFAEDIDNEDIILIKIKTLGQYFLVTKGETGYFELDCNYLCAYDEAEIIGVLVNVETK